jgi:hypothetical protein
MARLGVAGADAEAIVATLVAALTVAAATTATWFTSIATTAGLAATIRTAARVLTVTFQVIAVRVRDKRIRAYVAMLATGHRQIFEVDVLGNLRPLHGNVHPLPWSWRIRTRANLHRVV